MDRPRVEGAFLSGVAMASVGFWRSQESRSRAEPGDGSVEVVAAPLIQRDAGGGTYYGAGLTLTW